MSLKQAVEKLNKTTKTNTQGGDMPEADSRVLQLIEDFAESYNVPEPELAALIRRYEDIRGLEHADLSHYGLDGAMKAFKVSWYASGTTGTFNYLVVAESLYMAKEAWEKFTEGDREISYFWKKAKEGEKNHYGGSVTWKEEGDTDKKPGCYDLGYDAWNTGSDHLND